MAKRKTKPRVIVIAGPNGAGKSTSALSILAEAGVNEFVNADTIARGLSAIEPDRVAVEAGRIMLKRLRELVQKRVSFAFETTLASRSFAPWLAGLKQTGYRTSLTFLSLPDPELSIKRVELRVETGGHSVPPEVVRRRFVRGLRNLTTLYIPVIDEWMVYDNAQPFAPLVVAYGRLARTVIVDLKRWHTLQKWARS